MLSGVGVGNMESLVKGYKLSVIRWVRSEDPMYNMVTIVENTVLYNQNLLKEESVSEIDLKRERERERVTEHYKEWKK